MTVAAGARPGERARPVGGGRVPVGLSRPGACAVVGSGSGEAAVPALRPTPVAWVPGTSFHEWVTGISTGAVAVHRAERDEAVAATMEGRTTRGSVANGEENAS
ncbi:hypothetical protein SUDANB37_01783 [Streptomyces sp. enrichment culture]